jgi:neutral trehalase
MNTKNSILAFLYLFVVAYVTVYVYKLKALIGPAKQQRVIKKHPKRLSLHSIHIPNESAANKSQKAYKLDETEEEARALYMNEKFLRVVKLVNQEVDSKHIVDRATKKPLSQVVEALEKLDESNFSEIRAFVDEFFHEPGIEIVKASFVDWKPEPKYLDKIESEELKHFSLSINKIWLDLYKKFDHSMLDAGSVSSHLAMKHPFLVPGGRFLEMYYW